MRVTPLEIRQKAFEKHFRGYNTDEVDAFLLSLSQEWERIVDESKELRIKLDSSEREMMKLREVENSLYKTLKTAEDTGANVIEQAKQAADLNVKESQLKAETLLNEAKMKAKNAIDEAELRARQILQEMEERLKTLSDNYKRLESSRIDLLSDLKHIASDLAERVERERNGTKDFNADKYLNQARNEIKSALHPTTRELPKDKAKSDEKSEEEPEQKIVIEQQTLVVENHVKKYPRSFFDEIG